MLISRGTSSPLFAAHGERRGLALSPSRTTCTTARCSIRRRWCSRRRWPPRRRSARAARELLAAVGRRLRGRHPRRRVPRPLALPHLPHHGHGRHAGGRGGRGPAARSCRRPQMLHAFGSAGTQAAGLWEFLRDAADSKQLHYRPCRGRGLMAAYLAQDGFTGAQRILEGAQGMAAGMSSDADPGAPGRRPGRALGAGRDLVQVPRLVPPHASGRRCAAAGDGARRLRAERHRAGRRPMCTRARSTCWARSSIRRPCTRRKFSMGTVLGLIARPRPRRPDRVRPRTTVTPRSRRLPRQGA